MKNYYDRYLKIIKNVNINLYNASIKTLAAHKKNQNNIIYQTSATMSGPLLYCYVSWVLKEAMNKHVKRLYFLARDGYIMHSIAKIICEKNNIEIECKYLYCSRYALRIPQYYLLGIRCIDKICLGGVDITLNKIFDRAGLKEQEKINVCQSLKVKTDQLQVILSRSDISNYKEKLLRCEIFMDYVYEHSREAHDITVLYLKQEGLFDEIRYGIVDTGWTGSMQESLYDLLKSKDSKIIQPYGFYYGLYNIPSQMQEDKYLPFAFSKKWGIKRKVYFNNNVLECICCSRDGMTIGYRESDSKILPVMETETNINYGKWDIDLQIDTIISFALNAVKDIDFNAYSDKDKIKLAYKLCKLFMVYPTEAEAITYSKYNFSDDITEKHIFNLGISMAKEELKSNLLMNRILTVLGIKKLNSSYKESCWIEGSIAISNCKNKWWHLFNAQIFKWIRYIKQFWNL